MTAGLSVAARQALELVNTDPRRAALLAARISVDASTSHDHAAGAIAARAQGLAASHRGDLATATTYLRRAAQLGAAAASSILQGEAHMSLAFVLAYQGKTRSALRTIETALELLDGVRHARARVQRATILQMTGRPQEALVDYRVAIPALRRARDHPWTARALINRALLLAHRRMFGPALADLTEARTLSAKYGLDFLVGLAEHNLGWVHTFRGDIPAALEHLDAADQYYSKLGAARGPLLCDRSQLLLSARLLDEAREAAQQAIAACQHERRLGSVAEARLLLARIERLQGKLPDALANARTSAKEYRRSNQPTWAGLAQVLAMTWQAEGQTGYLAPRIRAAVESSRGLWPDATLDAVIAVARSADVAGHRRRAHNLLAQASKSRRGAPAFVRSRAWYAEALDRYASGNPRGAVSAVRAGLRILDEQSAAFGASDVRAHVAGHRVELAQLGVRIALEAGDARRVFAWSEIGRASHLQRASVRPLDDDELAGALAELRQIVRDIEHEATPSSRLAELAQRRRELEREIRDRQRRARADGNQPVDRAFADPTVNGLGDRALIEYVQHDGRLHVVCQADGRLSLRQIGTAAEIEDLEQKLRFALRRMSHPGIHASRANSAFELLRVTAARLDQILLRPVTEIGDRPVVLIPTGVLHSIPWPVLPSMSGRPLAVSPSAAVWSTAQTRHRSAGHVLIAAGPDLPHADAEAKRVAEIYGTLPLTGPEATAVEVFASLNNASIVHLAAHGRVRADNALFGSLRLADGPLMVYDLERLDEAPHTVIVAACDAGRPIVPAGDELLGLSATLLSQGTVQLIASSVPVLDAQTAPLMVALHESLAAGHPAAEALAVAQRTFAATGSREFATAASYLCFGAGFVAPPFAAAEIRSGSTR